MSKFSERVKGSAAEEAQLKKMERASLQNLNFAIKKIEGNISVLKDEVEELKNVSALEDAEELLFSKDFSEDRKEVAAAKIIQMLDKDNVAVQQIEQKNTEIEVYKKYLQKLKEWKKEFFEA